MLTELKNRGVNDILIDGKDGRPQRSCPWNIPAKAGYSHAKGFEEAINAAYPHTQVQQCIVHQVRQILRFVPCKARKAVAASLFTAQPLKRRRI